MWHLVFASVRSMKSEFGERMIVYLNFLKTALGKSNMQPGLRIIGRVQRIDQNQIIINQYGNSTDRNLYKKRKVWEKTYKIISLIKSRQLGLEEASRRLLALSLHNSVYIHLLHNNRRYFCNLKVSNTLERLKKHQCLHKLL